MNFQNLNTFKTINKRLERCVIASRHEIKDQREFKYPEDMNKGLAN